MDATRDRIVAVVVVAVITGETLVTSIYNHIYLYLDLYPYLQHYPYLYL